MSVRTVIITQARLRSTRLPGKVLLSVRGRTLLEWHLERLRRCFAADEVVLAATTNPGDDPLVAVAARLGLRCHRGPEEDVLERFRGAAEAARGEIVVRVTADCPLWDPEVGARTIRSLDAAFDYAANTLDWTYPRGLDTEVFWRDVLERLARLAPPAPCPEREHVTWMVKTSRPELFARKSVRAPADDSDLRWCVDTREDFACVSAIYEGLEDPFAAYPQVLAWVRAHPEVPRLNALVKQKKV